MRILIDENDMTNLGDVAMLQVAVRRLSSLWPDARIDVVTDSESLLERFCPGTHPVPADGRRRWFWDASVLCTAPIYQSIPRWITGPTGRLEAALRQRWPSLGYQGARLRERFRRLRGRGSWPVFAYLDALRRSDLVVLSGAGVINSIFVGSSDILDWGGGRVLESFHLAQRWGARTVMFGQGLGPIHTSRVWNKAKIVLPQVDVICLREKRRGAVLLEKMGVDFGRVYITGDDALEVAFSPHASGRGRGIGINIRRAGYSNVDDAVVDAVSHVLHKVAERHRTSLIPVPVGFGGYCSDVPTIRRLLHHYPAREDGWETIDTPERLVRQLNRCRVVVTGSYHAAVFALAQGIPAIGLANSEYYVDKFLGLADQFGGGCDLIHLSDARFPEHLSETVDRVWATADAIRPALLDSTRRQIETGLAAYRHAYELIEQRLERARGALRRSGTDRSAVSPARQAEEDNQL